MRLQHPRVVVLVDDEYGIEHVDTVRDALGRLGFSCFIQTEEEVLLLPPPHEVRIDGRTLRGDEYEPYADACRRALEGLPVRRVRESFERMIPLDWDRFERDTWTAYEQACASVEGWIGKPEGLARWFGEDERLGPTLWGSVEPPGLHVGGLLDPEQLEAWWRSFAEKTAALPHRSV